jgi:hypothetical protein
MVFSTRPVRQLSDATKNLLEYEFSMQSVPRCYKQDNFKFTYTERPTTTQLNRENEESTVKRAYTVRMTTLHQHASELHNNTHNTHTAGNVGQMNPKEDTSSKYRSDEWTRTTE